MVENEKKETFVEEEVKEEVTDTIDEVDATDGEADSSKESKKEKKAKAKDAKSKLEKENEDLKAELANLKNEYLKVFAEMENTKKRLKSEAVNDRKYASQKVCGELAGPVDMLVQIVNMPAPSPEVQNYVIGFQMISNQISEILKNEGLVKIEVKVGEEFNPKNMQAIQTEYDESKPENSIIRIMQNGYMYKDRILKPAMVVVNKKPEEKKEEQAQENN